MESSSNEIIHGVVKSEMLELDLPDIPLEDNLDGPPNKGISVFTLTIDEFENQSRKNFGVTNMYDLLNDLENGDGNSSTNPNEVASNENVTDPIRLSRQNSFSVLSPLGNRTLEEVWDEITRNDSLQKSHNVNVDGNGNGLQHGQQTMGEMTLEDFLVKVGINIQDGPALTYRPKAIESYPNSYGSFPNNGLCFGPFNGQVPMVMGLQHSQSSGENNIAVNGSPMYPVYVTGSGKFVGEGSNSIRKFEQYNAMELSGDNKGGENRRLSDDRMEQALERRQRRMIKNRESAARSRARKNAYTCELEHELNAKRKENTMLKLILAESENKRKKEALLKDQTSKKAHQREEKLKTIRRTLSLGW